MSTNTTMRSKADDEPQPRARSLAAIIDFRPRSAVKILNDGEATEFAGLLKTWMLARLLAWTILDQPPRKTKRGTRRLRRSNANHAGLVVLALLLHLRYHANPKKNDEILKQMFRLWLKCDGFSACFQRRGGKALLCRAQKANRELQCVFRIVDYMCRYARWRGEQKNDPNFTIQSAKYFVEKFYEEEGMGESKISKIWEKYKQAAPCIFAADMFVVHLVNISTIQELIDPLQKIARDQACLTRFIGEAAYAADVLSRKAHNIRCRDFRNITRVTPKIRPFSEDELMVIDSIDRNAAIAYQTESSQGC
jgi:hypothetical protein